MKRERNLYKNKNQTKSNKTHFLKGILMLSDAEICGLAFVFFCVAITVFCVLNSQAFGGLGRDGQYLNVSPGYQNLLTPLNVLDRYREVWGRTGVTVWRSTGSSLSVGFLELLLWEQAELVPADFFCGTGCGDKWWQVRAPGEHLGKRGGSSGAAEWGHEGCLVGSATAWVVYT